MPPDPNKRPCHFCGGETPDKPFFIFVNLAWGDNMDGPSTLPLCAECEERHWLENHPESTDA